MTHGVRASLAGGDKNKQRKGDLREKKKHSGPEGRRGSVAKRHAELRQVETIIESQSHSPAAGPWGSSEGERKFYGRLSGVEEKTADGAWKGETSIE